MKKFLAFIVCSMLILSCLTSASAERIIATPNITSGAGINNTFYATLSLPKKEDYYAGVSFTLFGTYQFYQSSQQYTTSGSFAGESQNPSQAVSVTGRVYPSRKEDTPISHTIQNASGYYRR